MLDLSKFAVILNIQDSFLWHYSLFILFYVRSKISVLPPLWGLSFVKHCWPLLFLYFNFGLFFFSFYFVPVSFLYDIRQGLPFLCFICLVPAKGHTQYLCYPVQCYFKAPDKSVGSKAMCFPWTLPWLGQGCMNQPGPLAGIFWDWNASFKCSPDLTPGRQPLDWDRS